MTGLSDAQVDHGSGEMGEAHLTATGLVASQGDAGKVLDPREQVLDVVPPGVQHGWPFPASTDSVTRLKQPHGTPLPSALV